ncbi:MAG: ferrous iron transport protein A [Clostridia bacterium]|nr:ferrous iron transport protein A [Clostridia bacterium]
MTIMTLNELPLGYSGKVQELHTYGPERRRMLDLGLIKNTPVQPLFQSPFGDPIAYLIRGTVIALRNEDAKKILIYI